MSHDSGTIKPHCQNQSHYRTHRECLLSRRSAMPIDVCLLDLNLPDISGYDLCQRLLEIHAERRPLLIALNGFGRPEDESRIMAAGFDHHMVKPSDIAMLQKLISEMTIGQELAARLRASMTRAAAANHCHRPG
jgi:DNA-binding response OmpR family regulator